MANYGILFDYLCLMALPSYLIYLCLYWEPHEEKLERTLSANRDRYSGAGERLPWRIALLQVMPDLSGAEPPFRYVVELNVGPWYFPRWRKLAVGKAESASHFLKTLQPSIGVLLSRARRMEDHAYLEGYGQTIHVGAFIISLVMFFNVILHWLWF